jgi:hypothetical protein
MVTGGTIYSDRAAQLDLIMVAITTVAAHLVLVMVAVEECSIGP